MTSRNAQQFLLLLGGMADQTPPDKSREVQDAIDQAYKAFMGTSAGSRSQQDQDRALPDAFTRRGDNDLPEPTGRKVMSMVTWAIDPAQQSDTSVDQAYQLIDARCRELGIKREHLLTGPSQESLRMLLGLPQEMQGLPKDKLSQVDQSLRRTHRQLVGSLGVDEEQISQIGFMGDQSRWADASEDTRNLWAQMVYMLSFPERFGSGARQQRQTDRPQRASAIQQTHDALEELYTTNIGARGATKAGSRQDAHQGTPAS